MIYSVSKASTLKNFDFSQQYL